MKTLKKIIAALIILSLCFSLTACNSSYAYSSGKYQVKSGVYIAYLILSEEDARSKVANKDKDLYTQKVEKKDAKTWIIDKAKENVKNFLAVEKQFDVLKLKLSKEDIAQIDGQTQQYWASISSIYEPNGVGINSFKSLIENQVKTTKIFEKLYDKGGLEAVPEATLKDYFSKNYVKVKQIKLPFTDAKGAALDEAGKKALKDKQTHYKLLLDQGEPIDKILVDYNNEQIKLSAAANNQQAPQAEVYDPKSNYEKNELIISKNDKSTPKAYLDAIFAPSLALNTPLLTDAEDGYYITIKYNLNEKETTFTQKRTDVLYALKQDPYKKYIEKLVKGIKLETNSYAINKYDPKNLKYPKSQ